MEEGLHPHIEREQAQDRRTYRADELEIGPFLPEEEDGDPPPVEDRVPSALAVHNLGVAPHGVLALERREEGVVYPEEHLIVRFSALAGRFGARPMEIVRDERGDIAVAEPDEVR